MAAYCLLPTHLVLTQSRMRPWATPPTRERRFLCTAARPGTQGSRTDGWGEIDWLVPRVNTRAARAVAALAALHRCLSRHTALSASQTAAQPIQRTHPPSLLTERVWYPPDFPFRARGTVHGPPVPDAMCAARSTSQRACARACACAILGCCMVRSSGSAWTGASPSCAS